MTGEEWHNALNLQPMPKFVTELGLEEEAHDYMVASICTGLAIERAAKALDDAVELFIDYLES